MKRLWVPTWLVWTTAVSAAVALHDDSIWGSISFWCFGAAVAALKYASRFFIPFLGWFGEFGRNVDDEVSLLRSGLGSDDASESIVRFSELTSLGPLLAVPSLFGALYGTLAGGVGGVLVATSAGVTANAAVCAWAGIAAGVVGTSTMAALTIAVCSPKRLVCGRRLIVAIAPLLAIPALWRCCVLALPRLLGHPRR